MLNNNNIQIKRQGILNPRSSNNFEVCRICEFHVNTKAFDSATNIIIHEPFISTQLFNLVRSQFKSQKNKDIILPCNCLIPVHLDCLLRQAIFSNKMKCSNCNFCYTLQSIKSPLLSKLTSSKFIYSNVAIICLIGFITWLLAYVTIHDFALRVYPWKIILMIILGGIDAFLLIAIVWLIVYIQKSSLGDIMSILEYDKEKYNQSIAQKSDQLFSEFLSTNFDISIGEMFDFLIKKSFVMNDKERRYESFAFRELEMTIKRSPSLNLSKSIENKYFDQPKEDDNEEEDRKENTAKVNSKDNINNKPKVTYSFTVQNEEKHANIVDQDNGDRNRLQSMQNPKDNLLLINRYPLKMTKIEEVDSKLVVSNEDTPMSVHKPTKLRFSRKNLSSKNYEHHFLGSGILRKQSTGIVNNIFIPSDLDFSNSDPAIQFNQSRGEELGRRVHSLKANLKELSPILKTSSNSLNDSLRPKLMELFAKGAKPSEVAQSSQVINNINRYNIQNLVINTGSGLTYNQQLPDLDKLLQENLNNT